VRFAVQRYGFALLAVAVSFLFTIYLELPALFFPAILVSAWYGGFGPGLLAVLFSLVARFLVVPAGFGSATTPLAKAAFLIIWTLAALCVTWLAARQRQVQHALRKAQEELELKVEERTRELYQANERLRELDRLKSMFIASMSHELRTPLNSVIGYSSVLLDEWMGPVNPEQRESLEGILRSGKHLLSLINDVIDVSKIEAGMIEVHPAEFDIADLVSEAAGGFTNEIRDKGLELQVHSVHQKVLSDRRRLLQCLLNLISNAVKYTERGSIRVEAALAASSPPEQEKCIEISVTDTGLGIKEEDRQRLFQPFIRLESSVSAKAGGTGLGLYLTKKLVTEVLQGRIGYQSSYRQGSRFILDLPVTYRPPASGPPGA